MSDEKKRLRLAMQKKQRELTEQQKEQAGQDLVEHIAAMDFWKKSQNIGCYIAHKNELRTQKLMDLAWSQGKCVYVPVVEKSSRAMRFVRYQESDELEKGAYGIEQPQGAGDGEDSSMVCDCFIVPACGLDEKGYRLGVGKGYYDDFLKKHERVSCAFVAVAYRCNRVISIGPESHDVPCAIKIWV